LSIGSFATSLSIGSFATRLSIGSFAMRLSIGSFATRIGSFATRRGRMSPQARRSEDAAPFSFTRRAVKWNRRTRDFKSIFQKKEEKERKVQGKT
jgi:hypothetical protein